MRQIKVFFIAACLFKLSLAMADVGHYFENIKSDPNALYAFLKAMPKGGELHYHLAGGAYPETMITAAGQKGYCLERKTHTVKKTNNVCQDISILDLPNQPELYNATIRAWSMKDFTGKEESAHDHFFASFFKFITIESDFRPQLLAEVMQRAADQNEHYMEIMILSDNARSTEFGHIAAKHQTTEAKRQDLLNNSSFNNNILATVAESERILKVAKHELNCEKDPNQAVCNLTIKFQYYLLREQSLDNLFAQALNGFEAASKSDVIVGINLVQAEDGIISLRDYRKQMALLNDLHQYYPNVHIALHAGELAPEFVKPEDLRYHIHDAIFTGHAERIGHGVDIAYENNANKLVKYMAQKPIPVEINLTSNRTILNIKGKTHPLKFYLNNQVPVVLSTDDEGILRTDLTREYVSAAMNHGLNYQTLKAINRNALTYSFLPGRSIWENPATGKLIDVCRELDSNTCKSFIADNEKARLQWRLEKQLTDFEKQYH